MNVLQFKINFSELELQKWMTDSIENQYLYQKQTVCKTFETKLFIDKKEKMSFVCAMPKQDVIGIRSENS